MKIIFMGTDSFALPSLRALYDAGHEILTVITQPDRPRGRGQKFSPSPVKELALELGLPLDQPLKLREASFLARLKERAPQLIVVAAYARLIPKPILTMPPLGCINVHPSLLPRYRGATPVEGALLCGEQETGISIFFMDEGYDTGDLLLKKTVPIGEEDTGGTLRKRLAQLSGPILLEAVEMIGAGGAPRVPQDRSAGEYTRPLQKEDGLIRWGDPGERIRNHVRAMNPRPGAYTFLEGRLLKVHRVRHNPRHTEGRPGEILSILQGEGPEVATGGGSLVLLEVQPEGKKAMSGWDFANGYRQVVGGIFSSSREVNHDVLL